MESNTYPDPAVIVEAQNFISVKINVDQQPAIADRYGAASIPLIVWLDSSGHERNRVTGGYGPAEFISYMRSAR